MKRHVWWMMILALGATLFQSPRLASAQNNLQALAARQELEDFIRTTNTRLRDLEEAVQLQQKKILALQDENRALHADLVKATQTDDSGEEIARVTRELDQKIEDVDRRRIADNKLVLNQIRELKTGIIKESVSTPVAPPPPPAREPTPEISANADLFEYEIQANDNLYRVVDRLRQQGIKADIGAIKKANPNVVWTKLQIGQKILIPVPK